MMILDTVTFWLVAVASVGFALRLQDIRCKNTQDFITQPNVCEHGCNDGYWGMYCNRRCPKHSYKCDRFTRYCVASCVDGYFGHVCSFPCPHCKRCNERGMCVSHDYHVNTHSKSQRHTQTMFETDLASRGRALSSNVAVVLITLSLPWINL